MLKLPFFLKYNYAKNIYDLQKIYFFKGHISKNNV